jgi:hypothetical protein
MAKPPIGDSTVPLATSFPAAKPQTFIFLSLIQDNVVLFNSK